jgi:hypothetical protein
MKLLGNQTIAFGAEAAACVSQKILGEYALGLE